MSTDDQSSISSHSTSTIGWDTVYAIKFPAVNAAIVNAKSSPASFSIDDTSSAEGEVKLEGTFGDWQLTTGGDGKNVMMALPIPSSSLLFLGKTTQYSSPIVANILVNMIWAEAQDKVLSGTAQNLQVDPNQDTISVHSLDIGDNQMDEIYEGIYKEYLLNWLIKNVQDFDHVFATININSVADKGAFQWLLPTSDPLYAVVDSSDGDISKSIMAVLCMTDNNPSPGSHEVSPYAIPDGVDSGFLISPERFLKKMILPGMPLLFKDATASDFDLSGDGLSITNNKDLTFKEQKTDDGTYQPSIVKNGFTMTISGQSLKLMFEGMSYEFSPGITVALTHTSDGYLSVNTLDQFKIDTNNFTYSGQVEVATWVIIAEVTGSIIASILGAVVGGLIGPAIKGAMSAAIQSTSEAILSLITVTVEDSAADAIGNVTADAITETVEEETTQATGKFATFWARNWAKIIGTAIASSIAGSILPTLQIIATDNKDLPTLNEFATTALTPVVWPNTDGFELKNGAMNGCLQLGINISNPST